MMPASIVIPTRARLPYLEVALASIAPEAVAQGAEVVVVDDAGASPQARSLCERYGARYEPHPRALGLNVARNTGVERTSGELVVFVDDDIEAAEGWLAALLAAARENPGVDVFAGPIRARLEGPAPRSCGREAPPVTTLDLGAEDGGACLAGGAGAGGGGARAPAVHDARPRRGGCGRVLRGGREHGDPQGRADPGGPLRSLAGGRRRRAGVAGKPDRQSGG